MSAAPSAPNPAKPVEINAPEVPQWQTHYLATSIRDSLSSVQYPPKVKRYIQTFLTKMEISIEEYRLGRNLLQGVAKHRTTNDYFFVPLRAQWHFEKSAAALYQAAQLTRPIIRKKQLFEPNDKSSPLYKLNKIYDRSKHCEKVQRDFRIPATRVWLTAEGLENPECTLKFVEMHGLIVSLINVAKFVSDKSQE